jgi:hypothetical protein
MSKKQRKKVEKQWVPDLECLYSKKLKHGWFAQIYINSDGYSPTLEDENQDHVFNGKDKYKSFYEAKRDLDEQVEEEGVG